jgi:hypothetical protein
MGGARSFVPDFRRLDPYSRANKSKVDHPAREGTHDSVGDAGEASTAPCS